MNESHESPAPVIKSSDLTPWEQWSGVVYFIATVILSSIVLWHWSAGRSLALPILIGLGIFFDAATSIIYVGCMVTRRHSSAFPGFGLICYLWAWLSHPASLLLPSEAGLFLLWCHKLLDIALVILLYVAYYAAFWLAGRSRFPRHPNPNDGNA